MKEFLSIFLMLTLLTGVTAMGQGRVGNKPVKKSRVRNERVDKKNGAKIAKRNENMTLMKTDKPMEQVVGEHNPDAPKPRLDSEVIYTEVDQMPMFPGGLNGLMEYLSSNIVYPPVAAEKNIEGKVLVQFVVEKDGSIGEIKILRSVDINLDYEAIRLCKGMPKLEPGMMDGKPVRVWYTLPVTFKLED